MAMRSLILPAGALGALLFGLAVRATTLHSVEAAPLIYKVLFKVNDLDEVEGMAPPGRIVQLWSRQRTFKEGEEGGADPFAWCGWKNNGNPVLIAVTQANDAGVWHLSGLRDVGTTVTVFPPAPGGALCRGGIYTELLTNACDANGACTAWETPTLDWLNVRKPTPETAAAIGSVIGAEQTALAVADGPDETYVTGDLVDVDQNRVDTLALGFTPFQRVVWRCGQAGTISCPTVSIHDPSTALSSDPEYPFILGVLQAHRHGGSIIAAAAVDRGQDVGFSVNVNVKFRGRLDVNLGCDPPKAFDFF